MELTQHAQSPSNIHGHILDLIISRQLNDAVVRDGVQITDPGLTHHNATQWRIGILRVSSKGKIIYVQTTDGH